MNTLLKAFGVGDFDFQLLRKSDEEIECQAIVDLGQYETVLIFRLDHRYPEDRGESWYVRGEHGKVGDLDNLLEGGWRLYEQPIRSIHNTGETELVAAIEAVSKRYIGMIAPVVISEGGLTD